MIDQDKKNRMVFSRRLLENFIESITGSNVNRVIGHNPEDKYFVGKLSPMLAGDSDFSSKTNIHRIGLDFVLQKDTLSTAEIEVVPDGILYYRVFPTLDEQRKAFLDSLRLRIGESIPNNFKDIELFLKKNNQNNLTCEVLKVYRPTRINNYKHIFKVRDIISLGKNSGYSNPEQRSKEFLNRIIDKIEGSKDYYSIIREEVNYNDLESENAWNDFIIRNKGKSKSLYNVWAFELDCAIKPFGKNSTRVNIGLTNTSIQEQYNDNIRINTIFNSGISIKIAGSCYEAIELDFFENDYKYNRKVYAIGENCNVISDGDDRPIEIKTTHLPIFEQYRLKTNDSIEASFDELMTDPVDSLLNIKKAMEEEMEAWRTYSSDFEGFPLERIKEEINGFDLEINRFTNGIDLIHKLGNIKEAFKLMNASFKATAKGYIKWRLFQIVFIVSLIPDICASEYTQDEIGNNLLEKIDVLYFPTGGGKTEAFFGAIVFTLFFDRLRGKNYGVSAIVKYPLRLLSIQQVDRLASLLATAETIRKSNEDMNDSDRFSIGYYVGDINTPNKLSKSMLLNLIELEQQELDNKFKIIDTCPFCKLKSISVSIDSERVQLRHCCSNSDCPSGGELPFYIVDNEIYRYLPSVIISTLDKFAAIGIQSNFRNIFGEVLFKCPLHGFSSKLKCTEKDHCKVESGQFDPVELYDPAPTLLIQDELHLVREALGVYAAHYESLFQYFMKELISSPKALKIIGASATVSSYKEQCYHLFMKDSIRFPCSSPYIDKDFYSYTDKNDLNRLILGYAPFGKAIINTVVYSMKYMKEDIWKYHEDSDLLRSAIDSSCSNYEDASKNIIDDYWIFLEYNNVKLDGNRVINALDDPINRELEFDNIQPFNVRKMTGDDTFQDVRRILEEVETTKEIREGLNLIVATSMISHGVDADRFNVMFFFGIPNNTAEYIQAYSRVGRKHPGIVVMIMRPSRERDQSYLRHFVKFHEFKDILVEPVPINRWATKAIDRTFPGVLSAILINHYDFVLQHQGNNIYMMRSLKRAIEDELLDIDEIKQKILESYNCFLDAKGSHYKDAIEEKVDMFFNNIKFETFSGENLYIIAGLEKLGFPAPMRSLRDTDVPVKIEVR